MKEAAEFFNGLVGKIVGGLNTCMLAEIVAFDAATMKADIELLPDRDLVKAVPVATLRSAGFIIRVPYEPGDVVMVVFSQRDIDSIMFGEQGSTDRMLDINDAMVVGGMTLFSDPIPAGNEGDLVIAKSDMSTKIAISPTGNVTVEAAGSIFLGGVGGEGIPLGAQLKTWLDNHTHTSSGAGKPAAESPNPSAGVFVK